MLEKKGVKFEKTTLKKGLEKLLPNLTEEEKEEFYSIIGYCVREFLPKPHRNIDNFYRKIDELIRNNSSVEIQNYQSIGENILNELDLLKEYSLGLDPDSRKLTRYRNKEISLLNKKLRNYED
jgi:hypothetical protein